MALLEKLTTAVSEFLSAGQRFVPDVEAIRTGPEAQAARAKRAIAATVWGVAEDDECRLADRTAAAIAGPLAHARARRAALEPPPGAVSNDPDLLAVRRLIVDLEAAAAHAAAWSAKAGQDTAAWVHERQRPGRRTHDEAVLGLLTHLREVLAARAAYAGETTRLAGTVDPTDAGLPLPPGTLDWPIARLTTQLTPPVPVPAPVPPGKVRVRVVERFQDRERVWHHATYAGQPLGPEVLDEPDATEAIKAGWAVEVKA